MTDGEVALQGGQRAPVEGVGDEAHVLHHRDGVAVAHRQPGRLLAPVLQRVETGVGQLGNGLTGSVDTEDAAEIPRRVIPDGRRGLHVSILAQCSGEPAHHPTANEAIWNGQ